MNTIYDGESWPYHPNRNRGEMTACANNPCKLHGGSDIMASSLEEAISIMHEHDDIPGMTQEDKHDDIMYHVTLSANVPGIMQKGLIPSIGALSEQYGESSPAIYLFSDESALQDANWLADEFNDDDDITVLAIHHHVPCRDFYETVITEPISPSDIEVTDIEF